jgi:DNA repair exonuclease SbcCD ATPase subunit
VKLLFVEMAGFRGFLERTRFSFPSTFAVLTGRNGVGKSTVLDAIDFALTGTINTYAVKGAKGGGLDEHLWWVGSGSPTESYVRVGFAGDDGRQFEVSRSREQGVNASLDVIAKELCSFASSPDPGWDQTLMQTSLIRDETLSRLSLDLPEQARAAAVRSAIGAMMGPDHTGRTAAILQSANAITERLRTRLNALQDDLGSTLSRLTVARSEAIRQPDVLEAKAVVAALAPAIREGSGDYSESLRRLVAERRRSTDALQSALQRLGDAIGNLAGLQSTEAETELSSAQAAAQSARSVHEAALAKLRDARELQTEGGETAIEIGHHVALLEYGELVGLQEGHCPLCDASRTTSEFAAAIAHGKERLSRINERAAQLAARVSTAIEFERASDAAARQAEERLAALQDRTARLTAQVANIGAELQDWGLSPEIGLSDALTALRKREEETLRLEQALYALQASAAHEQVVALEARTEHLRTQIAVVTAQTAAADRSAEAAKRIDHAAKEVPNQVLSEQFDTVMPMVKELYRRLRPHSEWREIESDFGGRVRASLNFLVGDGRNPQFLFSSGQRRAAGMAFLLAIHLSRPWCRLKSLLLDDPVQHIDDYRALNLVEVLSAVRRTGRQIIVAVEDPSLADLLCRRLRSSATEPGKRFELATATSGSATIQGEADIYPPPSEVLPAAQAS